MSLILPLKGESVDRLERGLEGNQRDPHFCADVIGTTFLWKRRLATLLACVEAVLKPSEIKLEIDSLESAASNPDTAETAGPKLTSHWLREKRDYDKCQTLKEAYDKREVARAVSTLCKEW